MDTAALHDLAATVRHTAETLQAEADALRRRVETVPWRGRAAEAMHVAVQGQLLDLARAARRHDDAAVLLDAHAERAAQTAAFLPAVDGLLGWAS